MKSKIIGLIGLLGFLMDSMTSAEPSRPTLTVSPVSDELICKTMDESMPWNPWERFGYVLPIYQGGTLWIADKPLDREPIIKFLHKYGAVGYRIVNCDEHSALLWIPNIIMSNPTQRLIHEMLQKAAKGNMGLLVQFVFGPTSGYAWLNETISDPDKCRHFARNHTTPSQRCKWINQMYPEIHCKKFKKRQSYDTTCIVAAIMGRRVKQCRRDLEKP